MDKLKQNIERTIEQSLRWIQFGIISPVIFSSLFYTLYSFSILDVSNIVYVAIGVTSVVCLTWWFWALRVIIEMSRMNIKATEDLTDMKDDVKMITHEVRESAKDLFVMLEELKRQNPK